MGENLAALKARTKDILDLRNAAQLLEWDMQACMPPGGAKARAEQLGLLSRLAHEQQTSPEIGRLLELSQAELNGAGPESDDHCALREIRRDYEKATKIPVALAAEIAQHSAISESVWRQARPANDFARMVPYLEKSFQLVRQAADALGYETEPYDALLDAYEPGAKAADVAQTFADLKPALVDLTARIVATGKSPDRLTGTYPIPAQRAITLKLVEMLGYDLRRGRQDEAAHPFCANFSRDDVRITTRFDESYPEGAIYASLHEAGHAMYEQGIAAEYEGTALGQAASMAVHESQSRLWENMVGRSEPFCRFAAPHIREAFPDAAGSLTPEQLYQAVNKVEPSLIRVEADEITYNLHIMLRFDLERALVNGEMAVADLPDAWNAKMQESLGITPPNDADGVLQDVHWPAGLIGYFPTYALGTIMSGQIWAAVRKAIPNLDDQIAAGQFSNLLAWLREHIHRHGRKYRSGELIQRATGELLNAAHYVEYLRTKYSRSYGL